MLEKPLLLQSAKSAVLVRDPARPYAYFLRWAALAAGLLCVLVGAADLTSRLAGASLGGDAGLVAFAPAITLLSTSTPGVIVPVTLSVPSLGINASVEQVGNTADGSMGTPRNIKNVGWYSLGAKPGEPGSAVFAGHVNNALTQAGVFSNLSKINRGDYVSVADAAGKTKVYTVSDIREIPADAPTADIFTVVGPSRLVLITCDGEWVSAQHRFNKRLVVIATPRY